MYLFSNKYFNMQYKPAISAVLMFTTRSFIYIIDALDIHLD